MTRLFFIFLIALAHLAFSAGFRVQNRRSSLIKLESNMVNMKSSIESIMDLKFETLERKMESQEKILNQKLESREQIFNQNLESQKKNL